MEVSKSTLINLITVYFPIIITATIITNRIKNISAKISKENEKRTYEKERKIHEEQKEKELSLCKEIYKNQKTNKKTYKFHNYFDNSINQFVNKFCQCIEIFHRKK